MQAHVLRPEDSGWGRTERRFGVPHEPGRWSCGASLCEAACQPFGWQKQMLKVCVNPPPVPIDAPLRESSTGGAYGTVPLRRTPELGRSRSGFPLRELLRTDACGFTD